MKGEPSPALDAPRAMVDEIFGPSAHASESSGVGAVAHLIDRGETLELTITNQEVGLGEGPAAVTEKTVADIAEADREIAVFLRDHPQLDVVRTGDGWLTHAE
jgi:hypothetical protein